VPTPVPTSPNCNVGTFFDQQQKKCLPCSDGCLACTTCYSCTQCRPEYTFNPASQLCNEVCGDGRRFTLQCDDGNNQNGDGCSSDCKI
jgi:cysteine-rich repeat protein